MKRVLEAEGTSSQVLQEKILSIQAEFHPAETSADSLNDLGERLMNLPFELKQRIIYSLTPRERCHLRLINKAMLDAVDASMPDVEEIYIEFAEDYKPNPHVVIMTINPYSGAEKRHRRKIISPSSLPFLLKWAGAQLKTLDLAINALISDEKDSCLKPLYQVFEALNSENICPKLKDLSLDMGEALWDNSKIILNELLKYVTKRQLQAMVTDRPTPFFHSLELTVLSWTGNYESSTEEPFPREKMRKILQDVLDQCNGLKELDVDKLLVRKDLPIVALRYPTTLTQLKSDRLNEAPGALQTIVGNCPNLQIIALKIGYPRDDMEVQALASLSNLRELILMGHSVGHSMEEEMVRLNEQCFAAFEDHPFGSSIVRPWPQLKSVALKCFIDEDDDTYLKYRLLLSAVNCCITSLDVGWCSSRFWIRYAAPVERLFKTLNSQDACPNLMELNINSCELAYRIADSLLMKKDRQEDARERLVDEFGTLPSPSGHVYGILNDLLAYVTKRQSEVRLGKPFLRSFSIGEGYCDWFDCERPHRNLPALPDQLEQLHTFVQQILDKCHGLEVLYVKSLEDRRINPNKKKGRELMELVPMRFPTTLKKLNGAWLN